jgi:hypothetical protein
MNNSIYYGAVKTEKQKITTAATSAGPVFSDLSSLLCASGPFQRPRRRLAPGLGCRLGSFSTIDPLRLDAPA